MKFHPLKNRKILPWSLPVRGAWIEIISFASGRGALRSLPVRGAWIEIAYLSRSALMSLSRSPCGERGLKYPRGGCLGAITGRSPCGERGLK